MTIPLRKESEKSTTTFDNVVAIPEPSPGTDDNVIRLPETPALPIPDGFMSVEDLEEKFVESHASTNEGREQLKLGRRWVADAFYGQDGDTVRTIRLRKGWSQTQLAEALSTSQSHVARIERGTENLAIRTCRRLCDALDIDMNTLDGALSRQEFLAAKKMKVR